jgi:hypothetical protein
VSAIAHKHYPSDIRDDEWAFAVPYLAQPLENSSQCHYPLREVLDALRYL